MKLDKIIEANFIKIYYRNVTNYIWENLMNFWNKIKLKTQINSINKDLFKCNKTILIKITSKYFCFKIL